MPQVIPAPDGFMSFGEFEFLDEQGKRRTLDIFVADDVLETVGGPGSDPTTTLNRNRDLFSDIAKGKAGNSQQVFVSQTDL